jgi:hypothetical protein
MRLVSFALAAVAMALAPVAETLPLGGSTKPFPASGGSQPDGAIVVAGVEAGEAVTGSILVGRVVTPGDLLGLASSGRGIS